MHVVITTVFSFSYECFASVVISLPREYWSCIYSALGEAYDARWNLQSFSRCAFGALVEGLGASRTGGREGDHPLKAGAFAAGNEHGGHV
jgi:hypothetical protein